MASCDRIKLGNYDFIKTKEYNKKITYFSYMDCEND